MNPNKITMIHCNFIWIHFTMFHACIAPNTWLVACCAVAWRRRLDVVSSVRLRVMCFDVSLVSKYQHKVHLRKTEES
jgi:hypothetical protein